MRTTIDLDEQLLEEAKRASGRTETGAVVRAALVALIERESARRLAHLGGAEPQLTQPSRRRPAPA